MTRFFDFISEFGHRSTNRRAAKKDPDLAERDRIRHETVPGVVLGSEGPGGLDGFFEDMTLKSTYRPWWWKAVLHAHWWMEKHGPRSTYRSVKYYHQRGRRGYSDRDLWSFDTYLSRVIRDGVQELNSIQHGWPEPLTLDDWEAILDEIVDGMQAHLDLVNINYDYESENREVVVADLHARRALAFSRLVEYWGDLWD